MLLSVVEAFEDIAADNDTALPAEDVLDTYDEWRGAVAMVVRRVFGEKESQQ